MAFLRPSERGQRKGGPSCRPSATASLSSRACLLLAAQDKGTPIARGPSGHVWFWNWKMTLPCTCEFSQASAPGPQLLA